MFPEHPLLRTKVSRSIFELIRCRDSKATQYPLLTVYLPLAVKCQILRSNEVPLTRMDKIVSASINSKVSYIFPTPRERRSHTLVEMGDELVMSHKSYYLLVPKHRQKHVPTYRPQFNNTYLFVIAHDPIKWISMYIMVLSPTPQT